MLVLFVQETESVTATAKSEVRKPSTSLTPRDYQKAAIERLEQERIDANHAGLLVMATGTGKTITSAFDTQRPGINRVLFIAHQKEIIKQARDEYEKVYGKDLNTGLLSGEYKEYGADFLFTTIQTLHRDEYLERFDSDYFDYIVIDEFHHAQADTYRKVLNHFNPKFTLGLTATPFQVGVSEDDLLELLKLEEITYRYATDDAIQNDDLAPFEAHIFKDNIDYEEAPGDLSESDLNRYLFMPKRNRYIAEKWKEVAGDRKTIVFCRSIEHAERTAQHFIEQDVDARPVHTRISRKNRDKWVQQFRDGELDVLVGVDVFNEGVDFPEVSCLLFMRPTMSKRIFHQQLGRGLRSVEGKDECIVLDFVNKTDWQRMEWYGVDVEKTSGPENEGQEITIFNDLGTVHIDHEAILDIADEYERYRFEKEGVPKEVLLKDLARVAEDLGRTPYQKEYTEYGNFNGVTIASRCGGWNNALREIGLDVNRERDISKEKIIEDLQKVHEIVGGDFNSDTYETHGTYAISSINFQGYEFVSLKQEAGIDVKYGNNGKVSKAHIIDEIRRVDKDHIPGEQKFRGVDFKEHGRFSLTTVYRKFDSWPVAKAAAGVDTCNIEKLAELDKFGALICDDCDASFKTDTAAMNHSQETGHTDEWLVDIREILRRGSGDTAGN